MKSTMKYMGMVLAVFMMLGVSQAAWAGGIKLEGSTTGSFSPSSPPMLIEFSNSDFTGQFYLQLDSILGMQDNRGVTLGQSKPIYDNITEASQTARVVVPEPSSLVLLGLSMLSIAGAARRKLGL